MLAVLPCLRRHVLPVALQYLRLSPGGYGIVNLFRGHAPDGRTAPTASSAEGGRHLAPDFSPWRRGTCPDVAAGTLLYVWTAQSLAQQGITKPCPDLRSRYGQRLDRLKALSSKGSAGFVHTLMMKRGRKVYGD